MNTSTKVVIGGILLWSWLVYQSWEAYEVTDTVFSYIVAFFIACVLPLLLAFSETVDNFLKRLDGEDE